MAEITPCSTCFGQLESSRNLFEPTSKKLLDLLNQLLGFQVHIINEEFLVCYKCVDKLTWISDFQYSCQKSYEKIRNKKFKEKHTDPDIHLTTKCKEEPIDPDSHQILEITLDPDYADLGSEHYICGSDNYNGDDCKKNEKDEPDSKIPEESEEDRVPDNISNIKKDRAQRPAFQQVSNEEVLKAIAECTNFRTDIKYKTCLYCCLVVSARNHLPGHMKAKHEEFYESWCRRCNLQTNDLLVHKKATNCFKDSCKFCNRNFKNNFNALTKHLQCHSKPRETLPLCSICGMSFRNIKRHVDIVHKGDTTMTATPILSSKNRTILVFQHYKYRLNHRSSNYVRWKCSTEKCPAFINTVSSKYLIVGSNLVHHHPSDESKIRRQILSSACKRKAIQDRNERPAKIIDEELINNLLDTTNDITATDVNAVRRNIYRARKRRHGIASKAHDSDGKMRKKDDNTSEISEENTSLDNVNSTKNINEGQVFKRFSNEEIVKAIAECTDYINDVRNKTCLHCNLVVSTSHALMVHMETEHKESFQTWCRRCNLQTDNLEVHMEAVKCFEDSCKFCDRKFNDDINALVTHLRYHSRETLHLCSICGMSFRNQPTLEKHENMVHKEKDSITMTATPILSSRNKTILVYDNYKFRFMNNYISGYSRWKCSTAKCSAFINTVSSKYLIVASNLAHNHPSDELKIKRQILSAVCKRKAVEDCDEQTAKIIDEELSNNRGSSNDFSAQDVKAIRYSMYRARKRSNQSAVGKSKIRVSKEVS